MRSESSERFVEVSGLRLHYTEAGSGDPVLLLHGWPTSSYLWRNVSPPIAASKRVIALDLPGYGRSDKPLDASYSFRYYDRVLTDFLDALEIERVGLAVHDIGGPLGIFWATKNPERLQSLALLNTLVYPQMSWAAKAFVLAVSLPVARNVMTSSWGLGKAMRVGTARPESLSPETLEQVRAPFRTPEARRALAMAGAGLSPKGFVAIARRLPRLTCPVRAIYGERDRILPDVAETMARVKRDLPQTEVTALPDCSHFLQEDRPDEVGRLLAEFFDQAS